MTEYFNAEQFSAEAREFWREVYMIYSRQESPIARSNAKYHANDALKEFARKFARHAMGSDQGSQEGVEGTPGEVYVRRPSRADGGLYWLKSTGKDGLVKYIRFDLALTWSYDMGAAPLDGTLVDLLINTEDGSAYRAYDCSFEHGKWSDHEYCEIGPRGKPVAWLIVPEVPDPSKSGGEK